MLIMRSLSQRTGDFESRDEISDGGISAYKTDCPGYTLEGGLLYLLRSLMECNLEAEPCRVPLEM